MHRQYFKDIENLSDQTQLQLMEVVEHLAFNADGLIPVITQDAKTKDVLMFAWMSKASLLQTMSTQRMTYWSRSRQQMWVKGESSGHSQVLVSLSFDCDGDCILCQAIQSGPACHTNRPNCFYLSVDG